jgi:hypothetical protein
MLWEEVKTFFFVIGQLGRRVTIFHQTFRKFFLCQLLFFTASFKQQNSHLKKENTFLGNLPLKDYFKVVEGLSERTSHKVEEQNERKQLLFITWPLSEKKLFCYLILSAIYFLFFIALRMEAKK